MKDLVDVSPAEFNEALKNRTLKKGCRIKTPLINGRVYDVFDCSGVRIVHILDHDNLVEKVFSFEYLTYPSGEVKSLNLETLHIARKGDGVYEGLVKYIEEGEQ